jgi:hypothetical protein
MSQEEQKYPNPPADMGELLQRVEREWVTLREKVLALPRERLTARGNGGWSVVDHMAHVAFWEQMLVRSYLGDEAPHQVLGVSEEELGKLDEDGENDIVYRRNLGRDPAEVLSEVWATHDNTVEAISRFPFQRLMERRHPGDQYVLGAYVAGNTYGHYMEHAAWIEPMLGE